MYTDLENNIFLLKKCSDYDYLRENLSDIELLTMESVIEKCQLIDNRSKNRYENGDLTDFPYGEIKPHIPFFSVERPHGYDIDEDTVKIILLWYENFEKDVIYVVDSTHEACLYTGSCHLSSDEDYYTVEHAVCDALNEGLFSITYGNERYGCVSDELVCHFSYKGQESEFYCDFDKFYEGEMPEELTPEEYIKENGLRPIAGCIASTIKSMALDEVDCLEGVDYLLSIKEFLLGSHDNNVDYNYLNDSQSKYNTFLSKAEELLNIERDNYERNEI